MMSRLSAYNPEQMCWKSGEKYTYEVNHCIHIFDCSYFEEYGNSFNDRISRIFGEPFMGTIEILEPAIKLNYYVYLGPLAT